ncbi:GTPase Era, partial [bacterium]|nr:GTPase Era [bacterium]
GVVSICGDPNVGKSTLLNAVMGQKMAIVSRKPQTTRGVIRGIYTKDNVQVLFVDNPGFIEPKDRLDTFMFNQARDSIRQADLVLFVVEPQLPDKAAVLKNLEPILKNKRPVFLIINKIDKIPKPEILPLIETYSDIYRFEKIIPISALKKDNVDSLMEEAVNLLPEGLPLFPEDIVSDQFERYFVAELIREKVFRLTHQELPYSVAVKINEIKQRQGAKTLVRADVIVSRTAHKSMIIGAKGALIKKIGQTARRDVEDFLGEPCYLELFVRVIKNWQKSAKYLKEFGYSN